MGKDEYSKRETQRFLYHLYRVDDILQRGFEARKVLGKRLDRLGDVGQRELGLMVD